MPAAMAGRSSGGETAKPDRTGGGGGGGGSSGNANGGQAQAQPHTPTSTSERIYSAKQLTEALKSGMAAVKDQLQVLAILDGTALSWPGVGQAVDDMEFLTDMTAQTTNKLEADKRGLQAQLDEASGEVVTLRESLASASAQRDDLQRQLNSSSKELRDTRSSLDETRRELQQTKQEVWALEKQRADLASELDRTRQEQDFLEGECSSLRTSNSEQAAQITSLKEELAARRADVGHLKQLSAELKGSVEHLKGQLEGTQEALTGAQTSLQHVRSEKQHYEKESGRLAEEAARLAAELERTSREVARLKEWTDVIKKVEADKLREEQAAHGRSRAAAEAAAAEAEKREALLAADVKGREEQLVARVSELELQRKSNALLQLQIKDLQKQMGLTQGERNAAAAARDEQRAAAAKLQAEIQRMRLEWAGKEQDRTLAEGAVREAAAAERARLKAQLEEAVKETALARTMAEGWQRDVREARARIGEEQAKFAALAKELEGARAQLSEGRVEHVRTGAVAETAAAGLRQQLVAKEEELRRVRAESSSAQKQLEKAIERLQREVDASAAEIARLKSGDDALFTRLPPVARAATLHDDLEALRRALRERMANAGGYSSDHHHHPPSHYGLATAPAGAGAVAGGGGGGGTSLPALQAGSPQPQGRAPPPGAPPERPPHLRNKTR
ncbi:hypothetical protein CHLRE_12g495000v5 [Chlamydomonas reinhardtii]|uniref:Uncharacterized protein n=1 Tax=Chlamydomonas reinhardtii TaxID=3055 RepID=A0A2K3D1Z4_CHLRE|nr:uncharacterized protein CHLRE_12g495000v5 [Chlamydomonas reinhardtii]PNW74551.1 hypothetical protein CHLRE_12g495000v5 [Chlamydomonas reinhardtii]